MLRSKIVASLLILANAAWLGPNHAQAPSTGTFSRTEMPRIHAVEIVGNKHIPTRALRAKIPFRPGDAFDASTTGDVIRALYDLGNFRTISIKTRAAGDNAVDVIVHLEEKQHISKVTFSGNKHFEDHKLREEIEAGNINQLDEEDLSTYERRIQKAYRKKHYHHVTVNGHIVRDNDQESRAHFTIEEGHTSRVRSIQFQGNTHVPDNVLRSKLFTQEDWVLGFLDRAGMYHPDALLQDKYTLEHYYQSNGFLRARVVDTQTQETPEGHIDVTFVIDEGELYTIGTVEAPGNHLLRQDALLRSIPIYPGQLYSKELIRTAMENLRMLWGEYGYIYADVQPSIRPDTTNNTVHITFHSDLGNQITIRRINIIGNTRTNDDVIRREILFDEGDVVTTRAMENSKRRVQLLGYFDPNNGVSWRIKKIDEETADLELIVREVKTGKVYARAGFGAQPSLQSITRDFSVAAGVHNTNWLGSGIRYNFQGTYSKNEQVFDSSVSNDWLFDRPITGTLAAYVRKTTYDDFRQTIQRPEEKTKGGSVNVGARIQGWGWLDATTSLGYEDICYNTSTQLHTMPGITTEDQQALQTQINRRFQEGENLWVSGTLSQDYRNHPQRPSDGYSWIFDTKLGIPHGEKNFGYYRISGDTYWYTPLLEEYNLVLYMHNFIGVLGDLKNKPIPYRELFHIGGPATVRGFKYGEIGPMLGKSSLGGTRAFVNNVELQFPISTTQSIRARIFYDGGASWETPDAHLIPNQLLKNNSFEYRHALGFGASINGPTPVRIDWGFKLDRKKKRNEQLSEVHISMSHEF